VQQDEEREICPENRLVYPFLTVWPSPRAAAVWKVRVERENEGAHARILSQGRRLGSPPRAFAMLFPDRFVIAQRPA